MTDETFINLLAIFSVFASALSFLCGWCFGHAYGIRTTSKSWQDHLTRYVDPLIKILKEQIAFYKRNSMFDKYN